MQGQPSLSATAPLDINPGAAPSRHGSAHTRHLSECVRMPFGVFCFHFLSSSLESSSATHVVLSGEDDGGCAQGTKQVIETFTPTACSCLISSLRHQGFVYTLATLFPILQNITTTATSAEKLKTIKDLMELDDRGRWRGSATERKVDDKLVSC